MSIISYMGQDFLSSTETYCTLHGSIATKPLRPSTHLHPRCITCQWGCELLTSRCGKMLALQETAAYQLARVGNSSTLLKHTSSSAIARSLSTYSCKFSVGRGSSFIMQKLWRRHAAATIRGTHRLNKVISVANLRHLALRARNAISTETLSCVRTLLNNFCIGVKGIPRWLK